MEERDCGKCKEKSVLVDAGYDEECDEFFKVFVCRNGHRVVCEYGRDDDD